VARITAFAVGLAVLAGLFSKHSAGLRPYELRTADSPLEHIAVISDSYTTGTKEGGAGSKAWPVRAWQTLRLEGLQVEADVAAECRAGYAVRGDYDNIFRGLTTRAVHPDDSLVVFFGSRNDQDVHPAVLTEMIHATFDLAHHTAPSAKFLVIGPPWPTADVPDSVQQIRDILTVEARTFGATFVDPIADRWFVDQPGLIGPDGVHPTDAGHAYLANKIAPPIREQLLAMRA
jgi:lysophospholipase L1-like esterase